MKKLFAIKNKYLIIGFLITAGSFYWFQYRPAQIKHDCSWVKRHQDAIPASSGLAQEQIDKECNKIVGNPWYKEMTCKMVPIPSTPAKPAKDWWGSATPQEYNFCLHDRGL